MQMALSRLPYFFSRRLYAGTRAYICENKCICILQGVHQNDKMPTSQHAPLLERDDFLLNILRAHAVAPSHRASQSDCGLQTPSPRALALPAFNAEQRVTDLLSRK